MGAHMPKKETPGLAATSNGANENPINHLDSKPTPSRQAIIDATERVDDLLTLWREVRRVDHRVHFARLRMEWIGLDPDEQDDLAKDVADLRQLVRAWRAA